MSQARQSRRALRNKNIDKINALLKYKKVIEMQYAFLESTSKDTVYITKDEFLFIYEGKDEKRDEVLKALSHYMTLIRIEYSIIGHGQPVINGYMSLEKIPVFGVPEGTIRTILDKR